MPVFTGTPDDDTLTGSALADTMTGDAGNDLINGGGGADTIDGGAGSDTVEGGVGFDTLIFRLGENAGSNDVYDGGAGTDRLRLEFTSGEWATTLVKQQVLLYFQHLATVPRAANGTVAAGPGNDFTLDFGTSTLALSTIEGLEVFAGGTRVDLSAPSVAAADLSAHVTEDARRILADTGTIDFFDFDLTQVHTVRVSKIDALVGGRLQASVSNAATGDGQGTVTWTYTLASSKVQALAAGEVATETYRVSIRDNGGKSVSQDVVVTVVGTNDAATISGVATGVVTEDSGIDATGTLVVTDVDNGDAVLQAVAAGTAGANGYGTFEVSAAGVWTYTLDDTVAAVQALDAGDTLEDSIVVFSKDGTASQLVTVTINGADEVEGPGTPLDLGTLTPAQGFVIVGSSAGELAGASVSSAGDVNGDGFDDIVIGAPYGYDGGAYAGQAYVVFGTGTGFGELDGAGRRVVDLLALGAAQGFVVIGDEAYDGAGRSVASAGDINGDGFDDLIIGAPYALNGGAAAGAAFVVFGTDASFGSTDAEGRQVIDLTDLPTATGFIVRGAVDAERAGWSVSGAGDVNGDGFQDLVIGAFRNDAAGTLAGAAYVVFGTDAGFGTADAGGRQVIDVSTLPETAGFVVQGAGGYDYAGLSVASVGDVNGDGFDDLAVGATGTDPAGYEGGSAFIVFGSNTGFGQIDAAGRQAIDLAALSAAQGFVINAGAAYDRVGISVDGAGDVNGDGFVDIIVGARGDDAGALDGGAAYVVFGTDAGFGAPDASGRQAIDLGSLTAAQGFVIRGSGESDDTGVSVAAAGDVNGDGLADLIVGASLADDAGIDAGKAVVLYGRTAGFGTADAAGRQAVDIDALLASQGFALWGDQPGDQAGSSVSSAGDVNADGFADLVIGAPRGDEAGNDAGQVYVVFGSADGLGGPQALAEAREVMVDAPGWFA